MVPGEAPLAITVSLATDSLIVTGELDRLTAPNFSRRLQQILETGCSSLKVDLSGLTFVDVSGYRAMQQFGDCCRRLGVINVWLHPSHPVRVLWWTLEPPLGLIVDPPTSEGYSLTLGTVHHPSHP